MSEFNEDYSPASAKEKNQEATGTIQNDGVREITQSYSRQAVKKVDDFLDVRMILVHCSRIYSVRLDKIGRLFGDGDDRSDWMPTDLVREDGRVDDSEALDAEYAQAWVNDASVGGGTHARSRRL